MKSIRSVLVVAAAGLALAVGFAFARSENGHAGMHRGMGHMMGGQEFGRIFHQLNLTDEQKSQIKEMHESAKQTLKPLMKQEFEARQQMMQLIASDKFEIKQAQILASQEAQVHMQLEVEHAKMFAKAYQLLNSDQKAKVNDMLAQHQQRMQQRMQNDQSPAPDSQ